MLTLFQVFLETFGLVIYPRVAGPEVENALVGVAAVSEVSEPGVVFVAVVFVALVSVADVAEPRASVDIAPASDVLAPVYVVPVEVDSSECPRFPAFPNVDYYSSSSSSLEVAGEESVHSSTGARTNYDLCSILSNPGLHQNRNLEPCYKRPNPGYNNVSGTNDLAMDATTTRSRKKGPPQCQEQRTHRPYRASLSHPEAPQIRWAAAAAEKFRY